MPSKGRSVEKVTIWPEGVAIQGHDTPGSPIREIVVTAPTPKQVVITYNENPGEGPPSSKITLNFKDGSVIATEEREIIDGDIDSLRRVPRIEKLTGREGAGVRFGNLYFSAQRYEGGLLMYGGKQGVEVDFSGPGGIGRFHKIERNELYNILRNVETTTA
ncbi:MAG TPA: hypothetical protein VL944_00500 [Candidatus Acidoferrum sp.]|nr:hypothetical protein [Candidatus Acidoferrum sp.]